MEGGLTIEVGLDAQQNATEGYKQEEDHVPTLPQLMGVLHAWAMLRIPENAMRRLVQLMGGGLAMEVGLNARQNVTEVYKQEKGPVPTLPQLMEVLSVREIQARRGSATWTRVP